MSDAKPAATLPISAPTFYIMLALAGGNRHGYGIFKEVEAHTAGAVRLVPGTLYRVIKQLLSDGWIAELASDDRAAEPERRRVYRLTKHGRAVLVAEVRALEQLVTIARERRLLPSPAFG